MKRKLLVVGFGLFSFACVVLVGVDLFQNSLSVDLKRTLTAAASPDCSEADLAVYIRDARLQVRTRKDREVFDKLARSVQLGGDSVERNRLWWEHVNAGISQALSGRCRDYEELDIGRLRSSYGELLDRQCKQELALRKAQQEIDDASLKIGQDEAAAAKKIFNEFRADLKLPPVVGE